jgi:hypothetical protein
MAEHLFPKQTAGPVLTPRRSNRGEPKLPQAVDIDAELATLGPTGYRPPCVRETLF